MAIQSNFPALKPTLLLDFANSRTVDPRITFTRASTATFFNNLGVMQTAASGVPRIDFNPTTLACRGLLIEEQRTNLLTYSEQFDNAAWTKTRSSITADAVIAPDGTLTGDKLVEDTTASNTHQVVQSASFTSGTSYTFTAYMKAGERTWGLLRLPANAFTSTLQAFFNLSTGVVGLVTASTTASITPVGNGWYRCSVTATATTTASASPGIFLASADNVTSYTGDGYSGIYIWGAQLEAGSFATSYIPTVAAQVTRSADSASMTGTNFSSWYRADEGTLFAEGSALGGSTEKTIAAISDNTANNRIVINTLTSNTNWGAAVDSNGVSQATFGFSFTVSPQSNSKIAFAYQTNNLSGTVNGLSTTTDTSGTIPVVNRIYLGATAAGTAQGAYIRKLAFYPARLANAQLQTLTA